MFALLGLMPGFLKNNLVPLLIAAGVLLLVFVGYKGYKIVEENAKAQLTIETQQETIKNKNEQIIRLNKDIVLREEVISNRDVQLQILNGELANITNELGNDANDNAPESLKELFRRLK